MSIMAIGRHKNEEPPFTPEAAKALESLESYEREGWNLTNKTVEEMASIEGDIAAIREGRCNTERSYGSYSSCLIRKAEEALRMERLHRDNERNSAIREQENRIQSITAAATFLERAAEQMKEAEGIEDKRFIIPRYPVAVLTTERASAMDDVSLDRMADMETRIAEQTGISLDRTEHSASVLEKHGGARGKRLAKVLRAVAEEHREDLEAHRANAKTAQSELDARAKRATMDQRARKSLSETTATVGELVARVAELEEKLASAGQ